MRVEDLNRELIRFQKKEITEHVIYNKLAEKAKGKNSSILKSIAADELRHYKVLKKYTKTDVEPSKWEIAWYSLLTSIFGMTFTLKAMESGEKLTHEAYDRVKSDIPELAKIISEEEEHEIKLIGMIDEERIGYISSMVLGLNDAIVELTGTLAGLTFALRNSKLVGLAGVITGISAALSMAVSEYLSQKSEIESNRNPLKASLYTGIAYILVVTVLVLPYFLTPNPFIALGSAVGSVVIVIALFTYFVSIVKDTSYRRNFAEMLFLSMGVMIVSFAVGLLARKLLGVEI